MEPTILFLSDLSCIEGVTRELEITSRKPFRSAGVYVLPGRTTRVTRLDSAAVNTHIFVNPLRSGATKEWKDYNRPKYLQSQRLSVAPGETVTFSNPYGGPLQIAFSSNDEMVWFTTHKQTRTHQELFKINHSDLDPRSKFVKMNANSLDPSQDQIP